MRILNMMHGYVKLRNLSVKQRIMITFIIFILIPSIAFLTISISSYSQYALNSIIKEKLSIMEQINKNISYQFENYENMTMTIYHTDQTRKYIDSGDYSEKSASISQFLGSIVNSEKYVVSAMLDMNGTKYISGSSYQNLDTFLTEYRDSILAAKGREVWIPTQNLSTSYKQSVKNFVLARAINSPTQTVGILWLFFNEAFFDDVLENKSFNDSSDILVVSPDKRIISSKDKNKVGFESELEYTDRIVFGRNGYFTYTDSVEKEDFIVVYSTSPDTGWTIVTKTPQKVVFNDVENIKAMSAVIYMLYAIFVLLAYILLSRGIFSPLARLSSGMRKVSAGNFSERLEKRNDDEIGQLVSNYNYMLGKITTLMEDIRSEEKAKNDEKMKVLSMQIGPHFIYNTLNSIKWMATVNKQPNIKKMVESLIKLMMNVTYNTNEEVYLYEEIDLIKSYSYIQRLRFMNFDIVYNIPEAAGNCRVIKFILQPVIENCILYAFTGKTDMGVIEISAEVDDILRITIRDNGNGFDTSVLKDMKKRDKDKPDHIGIQNVIERIQLNYGKEYGLDIKSENGVGTAVTYRLPVIRDEKEDEKVGVDINAYVRA